MTGQAQRFSARLFKRSGAALVLAMLVAMAAGSVAQGRVVFHGGKFYGELPMPGTAAPQPYLDAGTSPFTVGGPQPPLTYGGGPVMLSSKLYLIFWGPANSFAASYSSPIIQYAKDLATDHLKTTNEFSVGRLYYQGSSPKKFITTNVTYGGAIFDTTPYPAIDTSGGCTAAEAPCVTDAQLQNELLNDINNEGWPVDPAGAPVQQYLVYTPNGVNSCDGPGSCTFSPNNGYCAYHSQITGLTPGNAVATYSNLPYESGCDSGQAPAGVDGNADTDGTLDSEIHELIESATDPAGNAWLDSGGNEIGDKCTNPVVTSQPDVYGTPLAGSLAAFTANNQLVGGHTYYTQQLWSNNPTQTPSTTAAAGCVQRIGPSPSFVGPAAQHTGGVLTIHGSASTEILNPITSYVWNWGDGSPNSSGVTGTHLYYKAGTYTVRLTVSDSTGAANSSTEGRVVSVTGATMAPTISSFSPATGVAGTQVITIHGTNLYDGAVSVDGIAATVQSTVGTQITAVVPNGVATGKVTVRTDAGSVSSAGSFTPTLSITSFTPSTGGTGTSVTINGVGFNSGSTVKFGSAAAGSVTHVSSTQLKATVPAGAVTAPISVTNTTGTVGTTKSRTSFVP
jgi:PKD repeat protein